MFNKLLAVFFLSVYSYAQTNYGLISGTVINAADGSSMPGCNIVVSENSAGTTTDREGNFSLSLPYGKYTLKISYVGFQTVEEKFVLSSDKSKISLKIELQYEAVETKEVTVTGDKDIPSNIVMKVNERELKRMPNIYHDVMRTVQILPGVTTNNELSSGYNVRGGNFDNNLIYLNGFEIYRPFLLRQGMEENQTLISPDLANEMRFFNGSFPASYGDKMSSALEVNYDLSKLDTAISTFRIDIANTGASTKQIFGDLKIGASGRYSYPNLFLNRLHANGDYRPEFYDLQIIADYKLNNSENLAVFIFYARNIYDLSPANLVFHLNASYNFHNGIDFIYDGERDYSFITAIAGVKYSSIQNSNLKFNISAAFYNTSEDENADLKWDGYYFEVADDVRITNNYLKSGTEAVSNNLELNSWQIMPSVVYTLINHKFSAGLDLRLTKIKSRLDEAFEEVADSGITNTPFSRYIVQDYNLNQFSGFLQDEFLLGDNIFINAGLRMTYCSYNNEFLVSPRMNLLFHASQKHSITLSWGYYYQPPYYAELRNKPDINQNKLVAQKSVQYSVGWEFKFKEKVKFNLEAYYSKLYNLVPYYIYRDKLEYLQENSKEGYAYGFDATFQGEITSGLNSWISYAYLNTKERKTNSDGEYNRRLTDQNHTVQVFLQDKIRKRPHWQSHARLIWGSGYLFNLYTTKTDSETGQTYMQPSADKTNEFLMYFRMDMGLSAAYEIAGLKFTFVAEVLNVFNHLNYGGYDYVQFTSNSRSIQRYIPKVLSRRFFNLGMELKY